MRNLLTLFLAILTCAICPAQSTLEKTRDSLRSAAAALPVFEVGDFIYNRWPRFSLMDTSISANYKRTLSSLIEANYPAGDLIAVAGDPQPAVRTLAIALLFQKEDPKLLFEIFLRINDTAQTLPTLQLVDFMPVPLLTRPQTVGEAARAMIDAYIHSAGVIDFDSYQRSHHSRPYYLSWFEVRLLRATGLTNPFQEYRRPLLTKVLGELRRLPAFDRDMYVLCLSQWVPECPLATEDEVIAAAQRLGHTRLLQIIIGRPPGTAPDVVQSSRPERYQHVVSFILSHADKLLNPFDESLLAALEQAQRDRFLRQGWTPDMLPDAEAYARARVLLSDTR